MCHNTCFLCEVQIAKLIRKQTPENITSELPMRTETILEKHLRDERLIVLLQSVNRG